VAILVGSEFVLRLVGKSFWSFIPLTFLASLIYRTLVAFPTIFYRSAFLEAVFTSGFLVAFLPLLGWIKRKFLGEEVLQLGLRI